MAIVSLSGSVKKNSIKRGTYKNREGADVATITFRVVQDGSDNRTALMEASGDRAAKFKDLKDGDPVDQTALVWLVEPKGKPAFVKFIVVDPNK